MAQRPLSVVIGWLDLTEQLRRTLCLLVQAGKDPQLIEPIEQITTYAGCS